MSARHNTVILGLLAAALHGGALAQSDPVKVLVEQGQYWQSRGNGERAAEAWQKLLRLAPNHPDALYGLAQIELDGGRPEQARAYLAQLRRSHPGSPLIGRLEQAIDLGGNAQVLQQARQQARSGQTDQALATYQTALGGKAPEGPLALEYYQTLGGTPQGWEEARRGLQKLAGESPNDPQIALALAQHLTYRESTRREGIQQLAALARRQDVGKAAADSWRKALAWAGTRPADAPLYRAYLDVYPDDTGVKTKLDEIERQQQQTRQAAAVSADPQRRRVMEGFQALDNGDLVKAESDFQAVLAARPADGDALGGMGLIRLRQENFTQARDLLERASRQGSASRWRSALNSAAYWSQIGQAGAQRANGDLDGARRTLEQAIKLDPAEPTGQNSLGDVLAESGQLDAAEAAYRRVLARQPDNPDALRGLVGVMAQNNKPDQALALVEKLTPQQQERIGELGRLRAAQAVGAAKAAAQRGDDAGARVALEDALLNDPTSPWIRLDLARLYMKMGAYNDARGVMDGLLVSNPDLPEAQYASALLATEMQDWRGALNTLDNIPAQSRTRDMAALQKRAWVHVQAADAAELARQGRAQEAIALLAQAEPQAGQDPELLGAIALGYTDAGDTGRALNMMRQLLSRTTRPDIGLRLQYAAILLRTRQDVELAGILRQLQSETMNPTQRRSYEDIRVAYIVRQADGLRTSGDLVMAYDTLAPLLAERPDDPQVVGALARMYADARDYQQALGLYNQLLQKDPRNLETMLAAASMATSAKEYGYAENVLDNALRQAPQNPEVLTAAGRLYRAQGKSSKAEQYFAAAVQAENRQRGIAPAYAANGQPGAAPGRSGNPFVGLPGQRSSSTLAPRPFAPAPYGGAAPVPMAGGYAPAPAYAAAQTAMLPAQAAPQPAYAGAPQPYIPPPAGASRFAAQPVQLAAASGYTPYGTPAPSAPPTPAEYLAPAAAQPAAPAARTTAGSRKPGTQPAARNAAPAPAYPPYPAQAAAPAYVPMPLQTAPQAALPYYAPPVAAQTPPPGYGGYAVQPAQARPWDPAAAQADRPRTAMDELNDIQQARSPALTVGGTVRTRQGEEGLGKLTDIQAPIEYRFPVGDGRMALRATPVSLDAGTPGSSYDASSRFGAGPVAALQQAAGSTGGAGSQSQSGVGLAVAYESERLQADVGTTPLGFRHTDINAGLKFKGPINSEVSYSADVSRRPVTDSLLSFAGARDARTGQTWGGVSATGGRLELTWDNGDYGVYGYGAFHALTGENVASNTRLEGGGGLYWRLVRTPDSELTAGVNFTGIGYDKNLRYFTYGHGGYFSPQQFFAASVPVSWTQRSGRLSYLVKGSLGVQRFKEDSAPYFPTNGSLQSAAQQAAIDAAAFGLTSNANGAFYPGQTKTGLGYSLAAAMEYQIAPQLTLGGQLAMDNARDYRQLMGGVYLRYAFHPYSGPVAYPLTPYRSLYPGN
ncbi:cellulose synthase subunit BcsC-related outer membrane protein [Pigmentiphaga sp. GD03639]|uniref:Cellulose synthase operon C C-terminal domain-containing protein n=3 Tax=Pigmentiphaga TaxID=152267 RepID=A0ABP3MN07_9BURK|nr:MULTISPECIES: cellulose synthase subunit BcsC-related outer membrane protein [unclassified Pigmentiphaga]MDH2235840.1 cellulose synthase subunit BcsC-related outer membrane protein [Pigmentiphaga sp. GD03639]